MAISLNNVNTRLTNIENALKGSRLQATTLWSGSSVSSVTLSDVVTNYDFIAVAMTMNDTGSQEIIPSPWYGRTIFTEYAYSGGMARLQATSNKVNVTYNWNNTTKIVLVTGIKIAKFL